MRWLAALGVILLAFGVFVFIETRGTTSADADGVTPRAPQANATETPPSATTTAPTTKPGTDAKPPTLAAVIENIRAKGTTMANGTAPALEGSTETAGSAGSAERPADADDYAPYVDGTAPSAMRVKMRGAQRRYNNGNYKGAFEAADSLIQMWPTDPEAFGIAVPSLCAMGDSDKAASYLGRVTDEPTRNQIIEGCAGFGVKLP